MAIVSVLTFLISAVYNRYRILTERRENHVFVGNAAGGLSAGVFASFVDAIAGGGGLISLPAYLLTGMPAHMAIGSNKLSAAVGTAISTVRFIKSGSLHLKVAVKTAAVAFVGSALGAQLALHISDYYLRVVMMILLPCVAVFVLFNRRQIGG